MYDIVDISSLVKKEQYDQLQYDNFVRIVSLFEKFIFSMDLEFWKSIVLELENVLSRCDEIDYQSNSTAIAYSVWHFLDRYHRLQMMCKFLVENGCLNRARQYDVLDVGTGPSQVLFALSDHFQNLNHIEGNVSCTINPDYVEQSLGFRNFLHHFVEFALSNGTQYLVPFHLGRTYNAFEIVFKEENCRKYGFGDRLVRKYTKYRYDITVCNNFLTTKDYVEEYADTLRKICKYTRNHGLVIIIGASDKSPKYREMYPVIDDIILKPVKDRLFITRWDKVFDQEFNYKYDDRYGKVIGDYFGKVVQFLKDNKLWENVPPAAQKEFMNNIKVSMPESKLDKWGGVKWKMVVYRKRSSPTSRKAQINKIVHGNHFSLVDDLWKNDVFKNN